MSLSIPSLFLLILILSMDAFTAALAYGMERVRVPLSSATLLSLLSGSAFTASLFAGDYLLPLFPLSLAKVFSFLVLFCLSLYKFYDDFSQKSKKQTGLNTGAISRRLNREDKSVLSCREAVLLSLALSLDNISAGLCTGTTSLPVGVLLLFTILVHFAAIRIGHLAGCLVPFGRSSHGFAWLGAAVLMFLAFLRLLQ